MLDWFLKLVGVSLVKWIPIAGHLVCYLEKNLEIFFYLVVFDGSFHLWL